MFGIQAERGRVRQLPILNSKRHKGTGTGGSTVAVCKALGRQHELRFFVEGSGVNRVPLNYSSTRHLIDFAIVTRYIGRYVRSGRATEGAL